MPYNAKRKYSSDHQFSIITFFTGNFNLMLLLELEEKANLKKKEFKILYCNIIPKCCTFVTFGEACPNVGSGF